MNLGEDKYYRVINININKDQLYKWYLIFFFYLCIELFISIKCLKFYFIQLSV